MDPLLQQTEHRPWPLPDGPWIQKHTWSDILFAHWPVPAEDLRPHVPEALALDLWDGAAWIGITPFRIRNARLRGVPPLPFLSTLPEVDVRTCVRLGDRPGVFYFSLDAPNPVIAAAARLVYHMRYVAARVSLRRCGEETWSQSRRTHVEGEPVEWEAVCRASGEGVEAAPGSREQFLIERWALYTADGRGRIYRTEIHRLPWLLRRAEVEIRRNTLTRPLGLSLPGEPPVAHFSAGVDALIWLPRPVAPHAASAAGGRSRRSTP